MDTHDTLKPWEAPSVTDIDLADNTQSGTFAGSVEGALTVYNCFYTAPLS